MDIDKIHQKVIKASLNLRDRVHKTALILSHPLSKMTGGEVYLKCENEQYTGSFKARGSLNKLLSLTSDQRIKGVITASTGNHGLGFSRACELTGSNGTVFLPENASSSKIEALRNYPTELIQYGRDSLQTEIYAKSIAVKENKTWVSPYNDIEVLSGQGTIGVEILDELKEVDDVLATIGGGGMISGIASFLKVENSKINIVGCQPENSPEMTLSIEAGHIVDLPEYIDTLSDGSAGGIEPNAMTFDICRQVIDESILVSEEEIKTAIRFIFKHHKKVIEGAAGVAVGALMKEPRRFKNRKVVIVLCGANINASNFADIISE